MTWMTVPSRHRSHFHADFRILGPEVVPYGAISQHAMQQVDVVKTRVYYLFFLLFISHLKAWRIVLTRRACVFGLLLDDMMFFHGPNRPNLSRMVFRANWVF
jgi:hypothetical protein